MQTAVSHFYRQSRAHQAAVYAAGGGSLTVEASGRSEMSYGAAPYGEHALSAMASARRQIAFRARLSEMVKTASARSKAAKKAAKTRKARALQSREG